MKEDLTLKSSKTNGLESTDLFGVVWPPGIRSTEEKLYHLYGLFEKAESEKENALSVLKSTLTQQQSDSSEIHELVGRLSVAIDQFDADVALDASMNSTRSDISNEIKSKIDGVVSQQINDLITENNTLQRTIARMISSNKEFESVSAATPSLHSEVAALQSELVASNERYCKLLSRYTREKSTLESKITQLQSSKRREIWQLQQELTDANSQVESLQNTITAIKAQNAQLLAVAKSQ